MIELLKELNSDYEYFRVEYDDRNIRVNISDYTSPVARTNILTVDNDGLVLYSVVGGLYENKSNKICFGKINECLVTDYIKDGEVGKRLYVDFSSSIGYTFINIYFFNDEGES